MGWASELSIEIHNERLETDEAYAENYARHMDEQSYLAWFYQDEKTIDWFPEFRIDHAGYTEQDEPFTADFF